MGFISNIIGSVFGSKRTAYQRSFAGPRRLSIRIKRDAAHAKKEDKHRQDLFDELEKNMKELARASDKDKKQVMVDINMNLTKFIQGARAEMQHNASILVGVESILYQLKHSMIDVIAKELQELFAAGFDIEPGAKELQQRLEAFMRTYQQELQSLMRMMRKESRGSFQLSAIALKKSFKIEKEIKKDSKRLRDLIRDFNTIMDKFHDAENHAQLEKIRDYMDKLLSDVESELKFLLEIAEDDMQVMHKIKKMLDEGRDLIRTAQVDSATKQQWAQQWMELESFEQKTIDNMRQSTRTEYRREAA